MKDCILKILLLSSVPGLVSGCKKNDTNHLPEKEYPEQVFIENDLIRLGINTDKGGAITYLARKDDGVNLITGSLEDIRSQVYEMADQQRNPGFIFAGDRQHWYYENFHDNGWPIGEYLQITPDQSSAGLIGPEVTFYAENNRTLVVHSAFQTSTPSMTFLWRRTGLKSHPSILKNKP